MKTNVPVIVSAVRTPVGKFGGSLKDFTPAQLGSIVIKELVKKSNIDQRKVNEVIMGNVISAGHGQNIARQAAIAAGIPNEIPSYAVNKVCGSGLKSVILGSQSIMLDNSDIIIAGGIESMSQAPYLIKKARWGARMGNDELIDSMIQDGLWDIFNNYHMGMTAENVAKEYHITREEQDEFSAKSQNRAESAIKAGKFKEEIVPIPINNPKTPFVFEQDEFPRFGTTKEALSRLKPAFKKDGTVTAGNASGINDGAAAVLLMSEEKAKSLSIKPMAAVESFAYCGVSPDVMGMGPVCAIRKAIDKVEECISLKDIDLIEINEAFAAQSVAVVKELELQDDLTKINVNGGAIALGHPIGASGTRILVTLLHELKRTKGKYGLAALCIGGGQGIAMIVKSL